MKPVLTIDEVAAYLRVPKNTLYQWRKTGKGPEGRRVGKYVRYYEEDVEAWLDKQATV
ncbi:helix-turn-helix transcriptional regulator [Amycolatopsis sp. NPDC059027]|uniref:helix-turn-helix transcriptional regulator n=1 Tax=Amycolatopsis sp. NPDC059027 TaxID=3346709 RepID=UPI00366F85A8